jgi:hypothetical protein
MSKPSVLEDEKVIHLHGILFRVKHDLIQFAIGEDGDTFKNPRRIMVKGRLTGQGLDKETMDELREAIRTEGLQHPLTLCGESNLGNKRLTLLNGERRKLCIDKLISDKAECFDPASKTWKPAAELYEFIPCNILIDIDEKEKYKVAFSSNERAIEIGEGATVTLIRSWRQAGWQDSDIQKATTKSITWLRDTESLLNLDDHTFDALVMGEINRTVALELAKIADKKERIRRLEKSREHAALRLESIQKNIQNEVAEAEEVAEISDAQIRHAELTGGDTVKAEARKARAERKLVRKVTQASKLSSKRVQVTIKDLDKANADMQGDTKALTMAKIQKHHIGDLTVIAEEGGKHADKAALMLFWWHNGVLVGNRDLRTIFDEFDAQ